MSLIVEIQNQVKDAMKSGDAKRRDALRLILNALKTEEKEKRVELTPEQEIEILTREAKKRREAIDAYTLAGSQERADNEAYELNLIQGFLPAALTEDEVKTIIAELVKELEITSKKELGKVMKSLMPKIKGRFPGNEAKKLVDAVEL
ncbi:MAG: GatB/YqeY domain-containing protein [Proteobacteria bacterium]|jgi:uncharacterized protein YqeY|nr:GatB/YqeY domain-containing protein [Pseudomonadota bacterium]